MLRGLSSNLARLAGSFHATGNTIVGDHLMSISEDLYAMQEALSKSFDVDLGLQLQQSQEAFGATIAAAFRGLKSSSLS